jgi:hypothetical protein
MPRCLRTALLALLAAAPLAAADNPPPWSGAIRVEETISSPNANGSDRHELEHYAEVIKERQRQARAELTTAPPVVARVLREDIGFYEAELERIAAAGIGQLTLGRTVYFLKGNRMLISSDGARLVVDRGTGEASGVLDGQPVHAKLQPLPTPEDLGDAPAGQPVCELETRRFTRRIQGRAYTIDIAPGLPNPYALGLTDGGQESELVRTLAEFPGLPMLVSETTGDVTRSLMVKEVSRVDVADSVFTP